jgi:asparagine synthase (glutamine-hydrolysing)
MCGIAGVVGKIDRPGGDAAVRTMVRSLARRGPDGEGIERWNAAVLGHRRLAIYDLSQAGRQPMVTPDRSLGLVFNGSIYNFRELRRELLSRGCEFASRSDSEVLLHGFVVWGLDELLSRLRGMFAFALWDDRASKLYLVRDRLGVKPIVYTARDGMLAFASTPRALHHAGLVGDLDERAMADVLALGFVTDARSIYRGVVKVPAATVVEWSDGALRQRRYWAPPCVGDSPVPSFSEAVEETEHRLLRAVEARLHADVPVGALLSGGVDSGLVCWAIRRLGADVTAFTVATPGDPWDEAAAASATAGLLGIEHRVLDMSDHDPPETGELVAAYPEPFACASALAMLSISRTVSASAKVLLTGDGGDDAFLGYPRYRRLWAAGELARTLPAIGKRSWLATRSAFPRVGPLRRAAALLDDATIGIDAVVARHTGLDACAADGLLGNRLLASQPKAVMGDPSLGGGRRVLADFLEYEHGTRFVGEYLPKVDGATMHHGVEARSPFLDHEIWELASSLPFSLRLRHGRLKAVLRELARVRIGAAVAGRRKQGFGVPVQRWMVGRWRPQVEAALRDSVLESEGWIRSGAALALLARAGRRGWAPSRLWHIYVLESWLRNERRQPGI